MNAQHFISLATNVGVDTRKNREILVGKFVEIHDNIEGWHDFVDALYMANYLLFYKNYPGPIIEFGAYKGSMSCKISQVARLIQKPYMIFDSFNGPNSDIHDTGYTQRKKIDVKISQNSFSVEEAETISNLKRYGAYEYCQIIKGDIEDTLSYFIFHPSFVFIDVDDIDTTLFIVKKIWGKMSTPCMWVHEACMYNYMKFLQDKDWWKSNFNSNVPYFGIKFFVKKYGLPNSDCLNFFMCESEKDELNLLYDREI